MSGAGAIRGRVGIERRKGMDKPLKDWTLGEVKAFCESNQKGGEGCFSCNFFKWAGCFFQLNDSPNKWEFLDPPRFTAQEVKDAKALTRFICQVEKISRDSERGLRITWGGGIWLYINPKLFPSVKDGETVSLEEIAGCGE